jgi:DNA ligase-1
VKRFCRLFEQLDGALGTKAKVEVLADYFRAADPADAAWALHCLLGKQRRRLITGRRLRQIALEDSALPAWLFEECYRHVGDTAETIALLWGQGSGSSAGEGRHGEPLHVWMGQTLPALAALEGDAQAGAVRALWNDLEPGELLVLNKLLTGGFRVGVAQGLVLRALAAVSGLEESLLAHRLMGGFVPAAGSFRALLAAGEGEETALSRPYPFFLASPLETSPLTATPATALTAMPATAWLVEWKWDGIRGQLIHRRGEYFLWSRGEELLNGGFPELIALAASLPHGTVLDGEVIVWPDGEERPRAFAELQRRLGRKAPGAALLRQCPAAFVAYDLLEQGGSDRRQEPLRQRRQELETLHRQWLEQGGSGDGPGPGQTLRLSPLLPLPHWEALEPLRAGARAAGAEGLMLKALDSPYLVGRRRGAWWKHKLEPLRLDAVLLYAQAGSGRRANLFTDYTFGLWTHPPDEERQEPQPAQLVTFAKAYSGLDAGEIEELDRWIRRHTTERFGPVRAVEPQQVFELAFEGLQPSRRHRSGLAVRFPRISRWRRDKPAAEADTLAAALALMEQP